LTQNKKTYSLKFFLIFIYNACLVNL